MYRQEVPDINAIFYNLAEKSIAVPNAVLSKQSSQNRLLVSGLGRITLLSNAVQYYCFPFVLILLKILFLLFFRRLLKLKYLAFLLSFERLKFQDILQITISQHQMKIIEMKTSGVI